MANIFKKLIAGISTAAILATMAVPVALADDGDVIETWDYTAADAEADWTLSNSGDNDMNKSITDNTLVINSPQDKGRTATKAFSNAITSSAIMEYDIQVKAYGQGTQSLYIGTSTSDYLVRLQFPQYGASVKVNDADNASMTSPGDRCTPWMHIKHTFNFVTDKIDTEITYEDSGNVIYSGTTSYGASDASESIEMMQMNFQKANARLSMKKLVVTEYEVQLTDTELLESIMDGFNLDEDQRGMTKGDGFYTVTKDVTLPSSETATSVDWKLTQRPINDDAAEWTETSFAKVEDSTLKLNATDESADYYVKATATVAVNDETDTKEYLFVVTPLTNDRYPGSIEAWDYEFDDADWTISDSEYFSQAITDSQDTLEISNTSGNNTYTAYKNFTNPATDSATVAYDIRFYCRGENASTLYIGASSSDCLLKMSFPRGGGSVTINGGDSITLTGSSNYYTPWMHIENTFNFISNTVKTVIKNADGTELYSGTSSYASTIAEKISRFTIDLGKYNNVSIKNVVVWPYEVTDQEIVDYSKSILEITDLTKTDDVYTATADFEIPSAPEGTTVTWKAMQKAKDATEWTESSFITVSGTTATINPTSEIDNYDVKLVTTITVGEASDEKEFVIDLPNPTDEITGIIAAELPTVNTTDKNTDGNTITFNLSGTEVLKYDLALPVKSRTYRNTTIAWTSSDSKHISIAADGTATIMTSDLSTHEVTLTAVATYNKGSITYSSDEQKFNVTMGYTSDDVKSDDATLDKYKVRFDAAYDANFDVPSSTTSSITLNEEGYFGSDIAWTSNAPSVISTKGKYTKPTSSKTVKLTAKISSGTAAPVEKVFSVYVPVSTGSGGGGGSTSTTGTRGGGTSTGSIASSSSSKITAVSNETTENKIARLQEEAAASNDLFTDIGQAAWARDEINGLAAAGVINGKTDTEFAPNDNITRAEFAKILMGTFGLASDAYTTSSFYDVSTDAWYFEYVESAYNLGIINGVDDGVFAPDALITRQDMAVMVSRAAEVAGKDIAEAAELIAFEDAGSISDYAQAAVEELVKGGIINGMSDTEFAPLANATRAQAAKILYKFL